jgi:hypothetical protein
VAGAIRRGAFAGVVAAAMAMTAVTAQELTLADATSANAKLIVIVETAKRPRGTDAAPVRNVFTEREINAYFKFYGPKFLPGGIVDPLFSLGERGRITARATVDLDAVRESRARDWLDPLAYVTGSVEVTATGVVAGAAGMGTVEFESATVAGVAIAKGLLQELVRYYTATEQMPNGFDLDAPFKLPAGIRSVTGERGRGTIVQ